MARKFSSISVQTTLASGISNSATSLTVASGTGVGLLGGVTINTGDQFTLALDPDTQNEEIVFATAVTSDTFTVTRARAGTSGVSHAAGATVRHVLTGDDLTWFESNTSPVGSWSVSGSSSGYTTLVASSVASGTLTLPAVTDTIVATNATQTLTNKTIAFSSNTLTGVMPSTLTINAQTGTTYTLVLADASRLITLSNASAITLTVPLNSSVAFPTGSVINLQQIGAGQVTVAGASGVTVTSTPGLKLRTQYSAASLIKTGTDSWTLIGDLSA